LVLSFRCKVFSSVLVVFPSVIANLAVRAANAELWSVCSQPRRGAGVGTATSRAVTKVKTVLVTAGYYYLIA